MDQKQSGSRSTRSNTHNSNVQKKYFTDAPPESVERCQQGHQRQPYIMLQQICSRILTNILKGNQIEANHFCNMLEISDLKTLFIRLTTQYFEQTNRKSILDNKQMGEQYDNELNILLFRLGQEQMYDLSAIISDRIRNIDLKSICLVIKMTNQSKVFRFMMRNRKKLPTFTNKQMFVEQEFILNIKYLEKLLLNQEQMLNQTYNIENLENISYKQQELLLITQQIQSRSQFNRDIQEQIDIQQHKINTLKIKKRQIQLQCQSLNIKRNSLTKELGPMKLQALKEKSEQEQIEWTITTLMKQLRQKQQTTQHLSTEISQKQKQNKFLKAQINKHEQSIRNIFENIQYQRLQKKREHQKEKSEMRLQLKKYQHELEIYQQKCEQYYNQLQEIKFKRIQVDGKDKFSQSLNSQRLDTNSQSNKQYLNFVFESSRQLGFTEDRQVSMELNRSMLKERNLSSKLSHMDVQIHHQRQIAKQQKSQYQGKIKQILTKNDQLEDQLEKLKQKYEKSSIMAITYQQELYSIKNQLNRAKDELDRLNEENTRSKDELLCLQQQAKSAEKNLREQQAKIQKCSCAIQSNNLIHQGSEYQNRKITQPEIIIYLRSYLKKLNSEQRAQMHKKLKKTIQNK